MKFRIKKHQNLMPFVDTYGGENTFSINNVIVDKKDIDNIVSC